MYSFYLAIGPATRSDELQGSELAFNIIGIHKIKYFLLYSYNPNKIICAN